MHLVGTVPGLSSFLAGRAAPSVFEVSHPDPSSWQHRPPGGQPRNVIARSLITTKGRSGADDPRNAISEITNHRSLQTKRLSASVPTVEAYARRPVEDGPDALNGQGAAIHGDLIAGAWRDPSGGKLIVRGVGPRVALLDVSVLRSGGIGHLNA